MQSSGQRNLAGLSLEGTRGKAGPAASLRLQLGKNNPTVVSNVSRAFVAGSPTADQVKRAPAAFGAQGEDNGVSVGFGVANEIPKDDTTKSISNSPEGLLFDVTIDGDRFKGTAMEIAMSHAGTHIADIRSTASGIRICLFTAWNSVLGRRQ